MVFSEGDEKYLNREGLDYLIEQLEKKISSGTGDVDLSSYYTKTEIDNLLNNISISGGADGQNGLGSGSSSGSTEVYSTDEVAIGTWIDGKTIYRKVLSITIEINSYGNYSVKHNIASIDKIVNCRVIKKIGSQNYVGGTSFIHEYYPVQTSIANHNKYVFSTRISNENIYVSCSAGNTLFNGETFFVVEYTKTA